LGLRLEIDEIPKMVSVSKDKAQMVVFADKTGEYGNLLLIDLKKSAVKTFKAPPKSYLWQFNWQYDGSGVSGFEISQGRTKIWHINKEGALTTSELLHSSKSYVEIENLQATSTYLYYTLMGEAPGLYRYDWKSQKSEALSQGKSIKKLQLSPSEDRFAVVDYKQNSQTQTLSVYGVDAKANYEVFKSLAINQVIWQPDGAGLVFTAVEKEGKLSVYRANLADGQLQYLGEYPDYSIESLAFSPDSSKLLITYINQGAKDPIWITHILTLTEGGTRYDQ
jgi:WD40 repeat protein